MASPVVEQVVENSTNTAGTSHTINLPTATAGQLLLIILDKGSTAATINAHASLTELLDENSANGLYIAYRQMDGTEPASYTLTSSASTRTASFAYRISGAANPATTPPQIGTTGSGTSLTPDPPASAAPPSSKDYLFIAFAGMAGEELDDDTWGNTPPTNYTPNPPRQKSCGTAGTNLGGLILAAERALTTGSAEDPGTFNVDVSAAWRSQTVTIHPDPNVVLTAGANTINISAPDPTVHLLIPAGANTINISAPTAQVNLSLLAGGNTIDVSAPTATGIFAAGGTTLSAGQNTITITSPDAKLRYKPWTDAFTDADGTTLPNHDVNGWVNRLNTMQINTNRVTYQNSTAEFTWAVFAGITFSDDQYARITLKSFGDGTTDYIGVVVRGSLAANTYYAYYSGSNARYFFKMVAGSITVFGEGPAASINDTLELVAVGSNIYPIRNGVLDTGMTISGTFPGTYAVDTDIASGYPGVSGYDGFGSAAQGDDWVGGDVAVVSAGQNTITLSAPAQTMHLTIPAGANTINISAPDQSQLVEKTLAAGGNTVNLSAPTVPAVHLEIPAGQNTVNLSAPQTTQLVEITLAAGGNTINISAPTVPAVSLTIPVGGDTINISAPDAVIQIEGGPITLVAGGNTINISAPAQTVHLTIPAGANDINVSAPEETLLAEIALAAGATTVNLSAPNATIILDLSLVAGDNTINVSAPNAVLVQDAILLAGQNVIILTAPTAGIASVLDNDLAAGLVLIRVIPPIVTLKQTFPLTVKVVVHDAYANPVTSDVAGFARETRHDALNARNVEDTQVVIST